jgi:hypothetical protein
MIDINITRCGPSGSIIGRCPFPRGCSTCTILDNAGAVALQDSFPRVAGPGSKGSGQHLVDWEIEMDDGPWKMWIKQYIEWVALRTG